MQESEQGADGLWDDDLEQLRNSQSAPRQEEPEDTQFAAPPSVLMADEYYLNGINAMKGSNYQEALHWFSKAVFLAPNEPLPLVARAEAYTHLCDLRSAVSNYRKALLKMKDPVAAADLKSRLAQALDAQGVSYFGSRQYALALRYAQESLAEHYHPIADLHRALYMIATGDFLAAETLLTATLLHNEVVCPDAVALLVELYVNVKQDFSSAKSLLESVLGRYGRHPRVLDAERMFDSTFVLFKKAAEQSLNSDHLTKCVIAFPEDAALYFSRAKAYAVQKMFTASVQDLFSCIAKSGGVHPKAALMMSEILHVIGYELDQVDDHNAALNYFGESLKWNENALEVYLARGDTYLKLGKHENALGDYKTVLARASTEVGAEGSAEGGAKRGGGSNDRQPAQHPAEPHQQHRSSILQSAAPLAPAADPEAENNVDEQEPHKNNAGAVAEEDLPSKEWLASCEHAARGRLCHLHDIWGTILYNQAKYELAEGEFTRAIKYFDQDCHVFYHRALCRLMLQQPAFAVRDLLSCRDLHPTDPDIVTLVQQLCQPGATASSAVAPKVLAPTTPVAVVETKKIPSALQRSMCDAELARQLEVHKQMLKEPTAKLTALDLSKAAAASMQAKAAGDRMNPVAIRQYVNVSRIAANATVVVTMAPNGQRSVVAQRSSSSDPAGGSSTPHGGGVAASSSKAGNNKAAVPPGVVWGGSLSKAPSRYERLVVSKPEPPPAKYAEQREQQQLSLQQQQQDSVLSASSPSPSTATTTVDIPKLVAPTAPVRSKLGAHRTAAEISASAPAVFFTATKVSVSTSSPPPKPPVVTVPRASKTKQHSSS